MTNPYDPTVEIPKEEPMDRNIVSDVHPEDPKTNPMTYVALLVATLALLLSFVAIAKDHTPKQVQVGEKICLVQDVKGEDVAHLFCQE